MEDGRDGLLEVEEVSHPIFQISLVFPDFFMSNVKLGFQTKLFLMTVVISDTKVTKLKQNGC